MAKAPDPKIAIDGSEAYDNNKEYSAEPIS